MNATALLLMSLLLSGGNECDPPSKKDRSPCMKGGHCFDLSIDGQSVVPLLDSELRASLKDAVSRQVCWRLQDPVTGSLNAVIQNNKLTAKHLGALYQEIEIVITGLDGQSIPTRKGIRTDPTVRIGGVPMQTSVDVIDLDALPNGSYVATFRARGPEGWDRKAVYLSVQREP